MSEISPFDSVTHHKIADEQSGQRIDNFLMSLLKGVPKSRIYRLLRKGEIRVNKKRIKPEYKLVAGDDVRIAPIRVSVPAELPAPSQELVDILKTALIYEDEDLMVFNKPSGLASHGGTQISLGFIEAVRQIWSSDYLELAHRLDRGTSGCIVVTRNLKANRYMRELFRQRKVIKTYHALVHGSWPEHLKQVDAPLEKMPDQEGDRLVRVSEEGKPALTLFAIKQRFSDRATLVEASPASGRTHQIRVHAAISGHPIIGDEKYCSREHRKSDRQQGINRLCLHAAEIAFESPQGKPVKVSAAYDQRFEKIAVSLRI